MGRWWLLMALMLVLAGCAAPNVSPPARDAAPAPTLPLCDISRPAVAHHAGGVLSSAAGPVPNPCGYHTGTNTFEPTIGIGPKTGHVFLYPSLEQAPNPPVLDGPVGIMRSDDEGRTWTRILPSVGSQPSHVVHADPYFYVDPSTGRMFADDQPVDNCSLISTSDDEGATWNDSIAGCALFDHQTIFAGKPVTSTTMGYPNVVYRCAFSTGTTSEAGYSTACEKSLDGGRAWVATGAPILVPTLGRGNRGAPFCYAAIGHGAVGADGTVYVPNGFCGQPHLAISHDEGATWTNIRVSDLGMAVDSTGSFDHEAGVGADVKGNVYFAWIAHDRLPYLVVSRDGARTWSSPLMIGVPGLKESVLGELIVGGQGKLAFAYLGSTNAPGPPFNEGQCDALDPGCAVTAARGVRDARYANVTWNAYMMETVTALDADPLFFTASVKPPSLPLMRHACDPGGCRPAYDFLDVRLGPDGTPWASFVDGCQAECERDPARSNNAHEGLVGRLVNGPSLLDAAG